jgi:hypothetical protein
MSGVQTRLEGTTLVVRIPCAFSGAAVASASSRLTAAKSRR